MNNEKPILEGYITGFSSLLVTTILVIYSDIHPLLISILLLVTLICFSLTVLWQLSNPKPIKQWLIDKPVRFFIVGFIMFSSIIAFLDFFYLRESIGDILVEAHGLLFDLLVFGIILTIYENLKGRQDKIERYLEKIEDYRGWRENEAAYRITGIIKR